MADIKFLVNVFLIILLIHLVLKHFFLNENFDNPNHLPYKIMSNDIQRCSPSVKAGNYFVNDENTPNFTSNVLNTQKFYKINDYDPNEGNAVPQSFADTVQQENFQSEEGTDNGPKKDLSACGRSAYDNLNSQDLLNRVEAQTCFNNTRIPVPGDKPDNWNYNNELVMNGGLIFGDVVGFDSLNTGFAQAYGGNVMGSNSCSITMNCDKEPDDIRMGLGYPGQWNRENN